MERCPNCGAPARPNANFCTTCGVRLPDDLTPSQPLASTAAPPEPAAGRGWPSSEAHEAATPPFDDAANAAAAVESPALNSDEVQPEIVVAAESESLAAVDADAEPAATTWPASGVWPSWSTPDAASEPEEAAEAETGNQELPDEAAVEPEPTAAGPVDQAMALLDQIRALLPTAMAPAPASPLPSDPAVADALADALATAADDDIDALRVAMERAREHPKDIDTVLDLAGRVDAVIALLDAYDRLRAAAETTVAQMQAVRREA